MADPTPAEYLSALKTALLNSKGATEMRHPDGTTLKFDRAGLINEIKYWESIVSPTRLGSRKYRMHMKNDY